MLDNSVAEDEDEDEVFIEDEVTVAIRHVHYIV